MLWVWMFHSIFGMVVEEKQMSTNDRLERKKYMGVWRWESELTATMTSRFPNTAIRYMEKKIPNLGSAVLVPLKVPKEEILKFVYCLLFPCGGGDYWEKKENGITKYITNFHSNKYNSHS